MDDTKADVWSAALFGPPVCKVMLAYILRKYFAQQTCYHTCRTHLMTAASSFLISNFPQRFCRSFACIYFFKSYTTRSYQKLLQNRLRQIMDTELSACTCLMHKIPVAVQRIHHFLLIQQTYHHWALRMFINLHCSTFVFVTSLASISLIHSTLSNRLK